ncbi:6761_t:CDS:2, partial [Ambispora leptoticha]
MSSLNSLNGFESTSSPDSCKKKTYINDPIHNLMEFEGWMMEFVDTPEFQRLRNIKQLGSTYWVFPGASHSRFEHSLGVAWLSYNLVKRFEREQPELELDVNAVNCVTLAGLCHDLGHGPFSHIFDNSIVPKLRLGRKWCHEESSTMMLDFLVKKNEIDIEKSKIDIEFVKTLIRGQRNGDSDREFLFDIVANQRNSVDVDKFDYLKRDCYYTKPGINFDAERLMKFSRVEQGQICYLHKEYNNLYDMFHTRTSLHRRVYNHPKGKAIEFMIADAIVSASEHLQIKEAIYDPERYMELNDHILHRIEWSTDYANAREIIRRLKIRDLYKFVDVKMIPAERRKTAEDLERVKKEITPLKISEHGHHSNLKEDDIIVDFFKLNFKKGKENPLDSIKFYNDYNPKE